MKIPVLGIVENMSYLRCPDCDKQIELFGASKVAELATEYFIPATARMPLDPALTVLADSGKIEEYDASALAGIFAQIEKTERKTN